MNNNIPENYKLTEVGVIPMDWEVKSIKQVAPLQRGFDLPNRNLQMGIYPVVYSNGIVNYHNKFQAKAPGIITGRSGTIGKVTFVDVDYWPHNTTLWVTDFKNNNPKFIFYLFLKIKLERFSSGSGVPTLNRNDVHEFQIPLPKITEQTAIATALTEADALISGIEKLIAKKRDIKHGAMQKLLSPTEGWSVKKLGDVCISISSGKSNTNSNNGNYPIYGSTGIIGCKNTFDYEGTKILVARVGANAGTVNKVFDKYCVSDNTLMITLKPNIDIDFIFFKLIVFQLNSLVFGSGQPLITGGQLKNIEIGLPKYEEQTRIATILSDMDAEIAVLEKKLEKYRAVKAGMMQNLLTGQIRLV